jgi:hypothetical protein
MSHQHPDPEGHLTDITISAIRDLRDALLKAARSIAMDDHEAYRCEDVASDLNAILEPWGEGSIND